MPWIFTRRPALDAPDVRHSSTRASDFRRVLAAWRRPRVREGATATFRGPGEAEPRFQGLTIGVSEPDNVTFGKRASDGSPHRGACNAAS